MTAIAEQTPQIERLGNCDICGKPSVWNSPCVDPKFGLQDSILYCDTCSKKEKGHLLLSIKQHTVDGKRMWANDGVCWAARYNEVVFHINPDYTPNSAWFYGHIHIPKIVEKWNDFANEWGTPRDDEDRRIRLEDFMRKLSDFHQSGLHWCTSCEKEMPASDIAGHPLFAGAVCADCWKLHQAHLEDERKRGHVCRMCGQPYSNCCC